ncbi:uncharacterized protein LOC122503210 [Leptopilina heterotoma]|uniref:uncharacterized protein LOC122503210 n=1 Tax=Leptopilina heterotoma TaxID=63436 RepID=UPI001CA95C29|nr:uncharacterized protein LOC122503210 [Leptopilina heterotoma]
MSTPEDTFLVGYADDIAALITAKSTESAQRKLNQLMKRLLPWMQEHGFSLAMQKTEIVVLTGKRIRLKIPFEVGMEIGTSKRVVKHLGINLDSRLSFWDHIVLASEKAAKVNRALGKLMSNTGGPLQSKRRLLIVASQAILLYGSELFAEALKKEKYRKRMAATQRLGALRIASSYQTVFEPAIMVIAGVTPIDLVAMERRKTYQNKTSEDQKLIKKQQKNAQG